MRIAIAGMGPAGAYLSSILEGEYQVEIFEIQSKDRFTSHCAWATGYYKMRELLKKVGLNFDDYVFFKGKRLYVELHGKLRTVKLWGLCTFDKPRLLKDLTANVKVNYGKVLRGTKDGYDLFVDATGVNRKLLSPVKGDFIMPTIQYLVKFKEPPFEDFFVRPFSNYTGYLWYFPLGDHIAYVGAGDAKYGQHKRVALEFIKEKGGEALKKMGRVLRLTPPTLTEPHYSGKVVGVGESVGTVFAALGEGILPSMMAAELLKDRLEDPVSYSALLKERFKLFEDAYKFVVAKIEGRCGINCLIPALKVHRYFKKNRDHTGVDPSIIDTINVLRPF